MSSQVPYFYDISKTNSFNGTLPTQAIPEKKKNKKFYEATMDALETIGLAQFRDNLKFLDFYKMIEGTLVYADLVDLPENLREIEGLMEDYDLPTFLKHYDILGTIVNSMVAEYLKAPDKYTFVSNDEIASNEYKRKKQELIMNYVSEELNKEIQIKMIEMGIDTEKTDFQSEEEKQAYIQQIQQTQQEMTPPEIEGYMQKTWTTKIVDWANLTLDQDTERFYMSEIDRKNLVDFLLTGRCFRHMRVGYDFYKPEHWSTIETFFSQDVETKHVQEGEYVGRIKFLTPSQVVNRFGEFLSEKQQQKILNGFSDGIANAYNNSSGSYKEAFESNFTKGKLAPHEQYDDYNFALKLQDLTGSPMGESSVVDRDGQVIETPSYLAERQNGITPNNIYLANRIRQDLRLRTDLLQVTEAYWEGQQRVGYLTFETESGRVETAIVTDDLLEDFLEDNNIKKLRSVSLEEYDRMKPEDKVNTIIYTYRPLTYEGVKIAMFNNDASENIYLKCRPTEIQLKGDSNVYDNKLPVNGIVDISLANVLRPYQIAHNIHMNRVQNLTEKEIGILLLFDMKMLPSELKGMGANTEETLVNLVDMAQKTGLFPMDTDRTNTMNSNGQSQFTVQNLSLTNQIESAMRLAQQYKQMAYEQVGFNPQRLGQSLEYQTATGAKQALDASYSQTDIYFQKFEDFKKRALETHINTAQHAQKNGKDISLFYSKSDGTKALLQFMDEDFYLRKINVLPTTSSKKRRELETFKNYILNTNTLADDTIALAEFTIADDTVQLIDVAKKSFLRRQQQAQEAQANEMERIKATNEGMETLAQRNWEREEITKERDRDNKLRVVELQSEGRVDYSKGGLDQLNYIAERSDAFVKENNLNIQNQLQATEIERKQKKDESDNDYRERMLALKEKEVAVKEKISENQLMSSKINKN